MESFDDFQIVVRRDIDAFEGLSVVTPPRHADERGYLSEVYNKRSLAENGIEDWFVQANHVHSHRAGTLRGLHYQAEPHGAAKLVRVARGAIWDVVVDLRPQYPTFGDHHAIELSDENWTQIYVPRGFAHGFQTLTDDTDVTYLLSDHWSPDWDRGVRWDDPDLDIEWPDAPHGVILSAKDQIQPAFADVASELGVAS